jgi:hypothetical protein
MADRLTPMDFLVMTPEQFEAQRRIAGTVAANADAEGIVLYERAAGHLCETQCVGAGGFI